MYYLVYRTYSEYNQFEGSWDLDMDTFDCLDEVKDRRNELLKNKNYYRDVSEILTEIE